MPHYRAHVLICTDPVCVSKGAFEMEEALLSAVNEQGLADEVRIVETSRLGNCAVGPELVVYPDGVTYCQVAPADAAEIVEEHLLKGRVVERLRFEPTPALIRDLELGPPKPKEVRVVLRNCGVINPERIEEYIAEDGYLALHRVLREMTPEEVRETVKRSGLRGRGGAGFPTGRKWDFAAAVPADQKYVICNADEGDPGAFMNRRVLEGDPFSVLEGMAIAGYAIGASQGYIYVRAEYPIAVQTLQMAIPQARDMGLLGKNIFGSGFDFDIELRIGAGAFVCGEETALIGSIEGLRGTPRTRPPYPAVSGLWGKPTIINNVETLANLPQIILRGPEWFASMGTEKSKGTKTFAIAGDVERTGLIEVPLGITLREVIYDVGGGIQDGKGFKAVQTGGPLGGCLPESLLDLPIDYESLTEAGSIMGSGGLIVMDDETCMVDMARFFMEFIQDESCGKCVPCRIGTRRMLETLERITQGLGVPEDLDYLENLCEQIRTASLCGLGQGAPNPVLTALQYFRDEFEAHIYDKHCPAYVCRGLITYFVIEEACTGCTICMRNCPGEAITGELHQVHTIDPGLCTRCGMCKVVCNFAAVGVR